MRPSRVTRMVSASTSPETSDSPRPYTALTTAYSTWLKHVAVVDAVAVSAGFVLRAIAGAAATGVPISEWFFIVASFGSLFMVSGKRGAEAAELVPLRTEGMAALGYVLVTGWIEERGARRDVFGLVRHVR